MEYPSTKGEKLYEFLMIEFPGVRALEEEKNCTVWNPILNYAGDVSSNS